MKTVSFGLEADSIDGGVATITLPIVKNIVVRGYEVDVSFMPSRPWRPWNTSFSEILCTGTFSDVPNVDFGKPVISAGSGAHGNAGAGGGLFALILKTDATSGGRNSAVSGLAIEIPAGMAFSFLIGHAGWKGDAEMQGIIYYDER